MALGAFSQVSWLGVGDYDECWIIATYWPLVALGIMSREDLPTIREFRDAAGRPDVPGASGGNNRNIVKALKKLVPDADVKLFVGSLSKFTKALKQGYIASLSLKSSMLPKYLQFGFSGNHQVSVYFSAGKYYVMNPLAKEGSALIQISAADLTRAAGALFGDGGFHAVLIKAGDKSPLVEEPGKPPTLRPQPPRPLPPPTPQGVLYIQPYEAKGFYYAKHEPADALGNLPTDGGIT